MTISLKTLDDADVKNKTVLCRVDLNVPFKAGRVTDRTRITRIVPTVTELLEKGAKVILTSHFGRPKGKFNLEYSLAPVVDCLSEELGKPVKFAVDCIGVETEKAVSELKDGEVLLLENVRFHDGEEKNDPQYSKALAAHADIYVNDAFSCSHRKHSSMHGIAEILPAYAGRLLQEEIESLDKSLSNPAKPMAAIVGGSKISTKLDLLTKLLDSCDTLIVGGGMANTFLKAQGHNIAQSICEDSLLDTANDILKTAAEKNCEIILPNQVVVAQEFEAGAKSVIVDIDNVPNKGMILDAGPNSICHINDKLSEAKTVIWNGPIGAFELAPFCTGSVSIAQILAGIKTKNNATIVVGGGDSVAALKHAGLEDEMTYVSSAGGAFLEWVQGNELPGLTKLYK